MTERDEQEALLRAVQRSQKLGAAGIMLGILPPLLAILLYFSYQAWIEPLLPSWSECQSFACTPWGFIFAFGPGILVACGTIACGYIGYRHAPQYPSEQLTLFNISLALGAFWFVTFVVIMGTGIELVAS